MDEAKQTQRVKIEDLPMLEEMTPQEQKGIFGGRGGSAGSAGSNDPTNDAEKV